MEKKLLPVLEDMKKKVSKAYEGKKRDKLNAQIEALVKQYGSIQIPGQHMPTYESLTNKGRELLKDTNIRDLKKVSYYLRYCEAALYDFNDNIRPLNLIMKSFLLTCVLFFVLAPQYFSFILPLIFVVPIFMGLKGIRKRALNGLMLGEAVVPMGILVSTIWLRNAYLTIGNLDGFINNIAQQYKFSFEFTKNLTVACIILSAVLLASSITLLVSGIKYRKMFV